MDTSIVKSKQSIEVKNPVWVIIGLLFMFGFGYIPAPAPMTSFGMTIMGIFIGIVILWTFCDMVWPSLLAIVLISLTTQFSMYDTIMGSVGNWVTSFVIMNLLMAYALTKSGFTRRVTLWFMSRPFANRGPWTFTISFMFAALAVGLVLDAMPLIAFFLSLCHEMFKELDCKKGDRYPIMLIIGVTFAINLAFGMTPISHPLVIIILGVAAEILGSQVSMFTYMLYAIPVGLVGFGVMIAIFKFIYKPDMSIFDGKDFQTLLKDEGQPMDFKEKLTVAIYMIVIAIWVLPGVAGVFAPGSFITSSLGSIHVTIPAFIATILMMIIHVNGEPLLDFNEGVSKAIPWNVIYLIAGAMLISTAFVHPEAGITSWTASVVSPVVSGLSGFMFLLIVSFTTIILTNFSQNVPIGLMMVSTAVPVALSTGVANPIAVGVLVAMTAQMAFCIPSSFATVAVIYGDEWCNPKEVLKYGLIYAIALSVIVPVLSIGLFPLVFG